MGLDWDYVETHQNAQLYFTTVLFLLAAYMPHGNKEN